MFVIGALGVGRQLLLSLLQGELVVFLLNSIIIGLSLANTTLVVNIYWNFHPIGKYYFVGELELELLSHWQILCSLMMNFNWNFYSIGKYYIPVDIVMASPLRVVPP